MAEDVHTIRMLWGLPCTGHHQDCTLSVCLSVCPFFRLSQIGLKLCKKLSKIWPSPLGPSPTNLGLNQAQQPDQVNERACCLPIKCQSSCRSSSLTVVFFALQMTWRKSVSCNLNLTAVYATLNYRHMSRHGILGLAYCDYYWPFRYKLILHVITACV